MGEGQLKDPFDGVGPPGLPGQRGILYKNKEQTGGLISEVPQEAKHHRNDYHELKLRVEEENPQTGKITRVLHLPKRLSEQRVRQVQKFIKPAKLPTQLPKRSPSVQWE